MTAGQPPGSGGTDGTVPPSAPAIEFRNVNKAFGRVQANRDISLAVARGEIHGIVGENGAGKSTLMSILYGFYEADSGDILVNGTPASIRSSRDAIARGIGMVHQHFMLVDTFTVLENIVLGAEEGALIESSIERARADLEHLEQEYDLKVDPDAVAGDLPVGQLQRVEILKALFRGAAVLVLDEPTGVLTPQETNQLFRILRTLRDRGTTIVLITHKLREIMAVTDSVSVMRAGEIVAVRRTADTNEEELAELMVGRKVGMGRRQPGAGPGAPVLTVRNLVVRDVQNVPRVDDVSLTVRRGEIVGIAGVSGNGQGELLQALAGIMPFDAGSIDVHGTNFSPDRRADPRRMRELGVAHVPEDRIRMGLITAFRAEESAILGYQRDPALMSRMLYRMDRIAAHCRGLMENFDVRPRDPSLRSANLSGGNQQKLILARELERRPDLLLVGQPTRGVDIGAIEFIHRQLREFRDGGCAILLVSVELDEIMSLADRILVMFEGRIVGEVDGARADERTLGLMMANAHEGATQSPRRDAPA
ncbi:MAG: ABC transporter ATP-binding protein [Rhodospirillales bacterium]|nr:MAG: ABC transporter ATP-binding protein [Rhodospirillales bacterium]